MKGLSLRRTGHTRPKATEWSLGERLGRRDSQGLLLPPALPSPRPLTALGRWRSAPRTAMAACLPSTATNVLTPVHNVIFYLAISPAKLGVYVHCTVEIRVQLVDAGPAASRRAARMATPRDSHTTGPTVWHCRAAGAPRRYRPTAPPPPHTRWSLGDTDGSSVLSLLWGCPCSLFPRHSLPP